MIYIEEINSLTFDEKLIIILFMLFFLLLILVVIKLYKNNKDLKNKIEETSEELLINKLNDNVYNEVNIDEIEKEDKNRKIPKTNYILGNIRNKEKEEKINRFENLKPYQKNILKDIKAPTSPININNNSTIKEIKMNLNDFIRRDKNIKGKYSNTVEDIVRRIEKDINNKKPIELTRYEEEEEEQAIISYRELMSNKDKIYNITKEEEDDDFIKELKSFREDLKKE